MRPLHGENKRLRRCPCCQGKFSKKNSGSRNNGKSSSRSKAKILLKNGIDFQD